MGHRRLGPRGASRASSLIQSASAYDAVGTWIFFAVTYDGTRTTENEAYYVGSTETGSLTKTGATTLAAGKLKPFTGQLLIGNNSVNHTGARPFMGLIDKRAIHACATTPTARSPPRKIEALRAAAEQHRPEGNDLIVLQSWGTLTHYRGPTARDALSVRLVLRAHCQ